MIVHRKCFVTPPYHQCLSTKQSQVNAGRHEVIDRQTTTMTKYSHRHDDFRIPSRLNLISTAVITSTLTSVRYQNICSVSRWPESDYLASEAGDSSVPANHRLEFRFVIAQRDNWLFSALASCGKYFCFNDERSRSVEPSICRLMYAWEPTRCDIIEIFG